MYAVWRAEWSGNSCCLWGRKPRAGSGEGEGLAFQCVLFGLIFFVYVHAHTRHHLLWEKQIWNCSIFSSMSQTVIFLTRSEGSFSKKEPKASAIQLCCLSLCEAERRSGKKGFFVFLGDRKTRDSRSCLCFHKEKAGDPLVWSHFSQPVSGRSAAWSACGHGKQSPGVKQDQCGPKEPRVEGLSITPPRQDHRVGRDLIRVSFLEHLDSYHIQGRFTEV